MSSNTNGLPSPPSSPVNSKLPPSPPMTSLSLAHNPTVSLSADRLQGLMQSLDGLQKHGGVIGDLLTVSKSYKEACQERDVHMRSALRLQNEKDALAKQVNTYKANMQTVRAKATESLKKANDKAAGLEKDVKEKQASLDERNEELKKCRADLAAVEQKLSEAKTRAEVHKKAESAAVEAHKSLKTDMDKMQKSIAGEKDKFDKGAAELQAMLSYYLPTKTMAPTDIGHLLDGVFDSAYNVVYACFSQDLSDGLFARTEPDQAETAATRAWDKFTSEMQRGTKGNPLPASNTPAAKTMRIVAVMRHLGLVAATELFQPVYMGDEGDDVSNILARVKDPKQADAARRVLLQAIAAGRDGTGHGGDDEADDDDDAASDVDDDDDDDEDKPPSRMRAKGVVQEVLELVGGLLSQAQRESFCTGLFQWSFATATLWEDKLQPLKQHIVARSLPRVDDSGSLWSALVYPSSPSSAARSGSFSGQRPPATRRASMSLGSPPSSLVRPMLAPPKAAATAAGAAVPAVDLSDVSFAIWPVFTLADGKETVVKRGLVVTKQQATPAWEEIQYAHAPRRFQRMHERNISTMRPRRQRTVPFLDSSPAE